MNNLLASTLLLNEVIENKPPFHYFKELLSVHFAFHFIAVLLVLVLIVAIFLKLKFYKDEESTGAITILSIITLGYLLIYFMSPILNSEDYRMSQEWWDWKENYVEAYIEGLPTQTTTKINKKEIKKRTGGYNADVVFSVDGELISKSKVEIIPEGDEYLISYKYLAEDLPGYDKGYFDVKLIVPVDVQIK